MYKNQTKESQNASTQKADLRKVAAEAINSLGINGDSKGYDYLLTAAEKLASETRT